MKSASSGLIGLLNSSQQFFMAELYEFTIVSSGTVYRYTSADADIVLGGHVYSSKGPIFKRSDIVSAIGLEVDELSLDVSATLDMMLEGQPWLVAVCAGALDSATVTVQRVFMPTWGDTSLGAVPIFAGRVADADIDATTAYLTVKSWLDLLNIKMPRNLYQPGCLYTVFDSGCTLNPAAFQVSTTVSTAYGTPSRTIIPIAYASPSPGYFEQGQATFVSGANAGLTRTIKYNAFAHSITLMMPLPVAPANGDACILLPGCPKTQYACDTKFNNRANFRGYPYIPVAETAQ